MFILSFIIICLLISICFKLISPLFYWQRRGIFYVKPWTRFTKVFLRKQSFFETIKTAYNDYPDRRYYGSYQFLKPSLFVRDLDLIKRITVKDFEYFMDHSGFTSEKTDPILALNLFSLKGSKWRMMRSKLSPTFTSSKMKLMYNLMADIAENFVDFFNKSQTNDIITLEMKEIYSKYTNDIIANCAFGIKLDSLKSPENDFFQMGQIFQTTSLLRLLRSLLFGFFPKIFEFLRIPVIDPSISNFFHKLIIETIQLREIEKIERPDMINLLMEARKNNPKQEIDHQNYEEIDGISVDSNIEITDEIITAQALVFFIAGFTTASSLMSFLSYELALQPTIQERLYDEINKIVRNNPKQRLPYEEIMQMKYLDQVVSEALRKWPPGYVLNRICVKDYEIPATKPDEKHLTINKGCLIAIPAVAIHYSEEFYPDPDRFDPDRFSDENKSKIIPGSYMPFGLGPRNCIGSRFALLEIKTLLVNLLINFQIVPVEKTEIPVQLAKSFSLEAKNGIWLGFKRRL